MAKTGEILRPQLFKFDLNLKTVLWGGNKIAAFKGVTLDTNNVGESWEISGLKGRESVVLEGEHAGTSLRKLIRRYKGQLVGQRVYRKHGNEFPLLVKFIDAHRDLSVQVHPDDDLARRRHNCSGKAEMWYIIDAEPGASLLAGMRRTITPKEYLEHMEQGTLLDVLARHQTHEGDIFFLPAGRIHSIGAGNLLLEVQQSSDITYRVYDYNRLDTNGKPRKLHTELAIDAIDYTVSRDCLRHYPDRSGKIRLINSIFFDVDRLMVDGSFQLPMPHDAFLCLMCVGGHATINCGNGTLYDINHGESMLAPACVRSLDFKGNATIITATV
jgi:mannose-6-phosphate isomerase